MADHPLTARDCMRALSRHYAGRNGQRDYILIPELRVGAINVPADRQHERSNFERGYESDWDPSENLAARIDAWAMHLRKPNHALAFEIKVDRQDLQHELIHPLKRRPAMAVSTEFYFVAPVGLFEFGQVPEDCGLIEVHANRRGGLRQLYTRIAAVAPRREMEDLPWSFVASIALRAS